MYNFGPAKKDEVVVYGAERPGYHVPNISPENIEDWIAYMKQQDIQRVCCLLNDKQLTLYPIELIDVYQNEFGVENVCHAPVEDYHLISADYLTRIVLPFLRQTFIRKQKVVVHCSGGSGRTGHVLVAWLVYFRNSTMEDALEAVKKVNGAARNPFEAIQMGNATEEEFNQLFQSVLALKDQNHEQEGFMGSREFSKTETERLIHKLLTIVPSLRVMPGYSKWLVSRSTDLSVYLTFSRDDMLFYDVSSEDMKSWLAYSRAFVIFILGSNSETLIIPVCDIRDMITRYQIKQSGRDGIDHKLHVDFGHNQISFREAPGFELKKYHNNFDQLIK